MSRRLAVHVAAWLAGLAVIRVAVMPAEACPPVTAAEAAVSIEEAAGWIVRNQGDDGRFTYGYDLESDTVASEYNSARHAGVTMSLYQAYEAVGDPGHLAAADAGLAYMLGRLVEGDGWLAWAEPGVDLPTGANGLFLAAMALRHRATGDPVHDGVMRGVAAFLVAQQEPGGAVRALRDRTTGEPEEVYGAFATGEAAWALVLTGAVLPDEGWAEAALPVLDYIAGERDRREGYIARLPDHWAAYTLGDLPPGHLDAARLALAERLAGYFGMRLRFEAQRTGEGLNLWVRWYPGPPAGVGTAGEGIGALYPLIVSEPSLAGLAANVEERIVCTAGIMVERQVGAAEAGDLPRPGLARGAWFYRGYTQMDGQQHVLSALLVALPVLEAREEGR